jgi:exodeoxyribonuclease VII large subunit
VSPNGEREFSVKALAEYVKRKLHADDALRSARVRGEVSNYRESAGGHLNFTLVEGKVVLPCFAFQDDFLRFPTFANGAAVVAAGQVTIFAQRGSYQLVVRNIELAGVGDLHRLFEERKRKLAAEGLFDPARRRPLPAFPFRVALVSSRRADGAKDFVTRLRLTRPHVKVVWCETSVQGASAPHEIVGALARASQYDVDAVVVTRGGGSFEDLFAFSDESVVRAIVSCRHPVVSAVGHTVDQQLSDFAADLHAETPSAAAERIGPPTIELERRTSDAIRGARRSAEHGNVQRQSDLSKILRHSNFDDPKLFLLPYRQELERLDDGLSERLHAILRTQTRKLALLASGVQQRDPSRRLVEWSGRLEKARARLEAGARRRVATSRARFESASQRLSPAARGAMARMASALRVEAERLDGRSPEAILQRGYAIVTHAGAIVLDSLSVPVGAPVEARLARGTLTARVEGRTTDGNANLG